MSVEVELAGDDDAVALVDAADGTVTTYGALRRAVDRRAEVWSNHRGAVAMLGMAATTSSVIDLLALLRARVTTLLVDPATPPARIASWAAAYRPEVVVGLGAADRCDPVPDAEVRREAILLPTSGSTGSPKFVRLTGENLAANATQIATALRIDHGARAFAHLPLFYSYGLSVLTSHLVAGASVVLSTASAIRPEFWDAIEEHRVTSLPGVPYSYEVYRRTDFGGRALPYLTDLTQAGGRLDPGHVAALHERMAARGGRMWVMYGQTEATARIAVLPPEELPDRAGSVGRALPGSTVRVEDPDADGIGELVVAGPQVMLGYAEHRGDLDGVDRLGGILHTGDLGVIDDDGWIRVTGRTKRMAKIFGARVSLDDVEAALADLGRVAVVDDGDGIAVALEAADAPDGIERHIERRLGFGPRSVRVHLFTAIPRTAAGKPDYAEVRARCQR